jgi:hypothetical protein
MVARPALIIYSFAPKELPNNQESCRQAHDYLKKLWDDCGALGMSQRWPGLDIPTEFPSAIDVNDPLFRILAVKIDLERKADKEDYQAFLFEYQDIVGFVATLETNMSAGDIAQWRALLEEWTSAVGPVEVPKGIMEETYLFTALHENDAFSFSCKSNNQLLTAVSNLGQDVSQALPGNAGPLWPVTSPYISDAGYCIWGAEQLNLRRAVALLAPQDKKDVLFKWTVWPDPRVLAPFARYLLHAAKLRFAQQVFEDEITKLHDDSRRLDNALREIVSVYQRSDDDRMWRQHDITQAHHALVSEQSRNFNLMYGISKLTELSLTSRIAARNMRKLVPPPHPQSALTDDTLFGRDRARSLWLTEQIQMDLGYLTALRERVSEGHKVATLLLERESQKASRRLKNLILIQGTLIGSLTIGLLMLPAYETFKEHHLLVSAVLAFLMSIVLALPVLFERWHEQYTRLDRLAGGVLGTAALFLASTLGGKILHKQVPLTIYVMSNVVLCIVGFLLGYLGVGQMEKLKTIKH